MDHRDEHRHSHRESRDRDSHRDRDSRDSRENRDHGDTQREIRSKREFTQERGRTVEKKSRWNEPKDKVSIPGIPLSLPELSNEQAEHYCLLVRIEELGRKARLNECMPKDKRSVSPPQTYGGDGKRNNTRELRYRQMVEEERQELVELALRVIPGFKVPGDYKRGQKNTDKVYIPVKDFPEVNFIGLLIGPRGLTLKKMEADSGTKIAIRGKGSLKEGRTRDMYGPGDDDDLHALVMADTDAAVRRGIQAVNKIIEMATSVPEAQNALKQIQLRQLAELNGTLRDDEGSLCANCGQPGHKRWNCPEKQNFVTNLICRVCGGAGHLARDCLQAGNNRELSYNNNLDSEYASMMAEMNTAPAAPWDQSNAYGQPVGQGQYGDAGQEAYAQKPAPAQPKAQAPWAAQFAAPITADMFGPIPPPLPDQQRQ